MKVMTILGTRPEIIRLSQIIPKLDEACKHVLVHTGQSFSPNMSDVFFQELGLREPNYYWGVESHTFAEQIGKIIFETEQVLLEEKPDKLLILGDTNSGLSAFVAKRMGVPVYHMEAGNRCYDDVVPEEVNRRVIDACSDILMPYNEHSRRNLLKEGIPNGKIKVTGNPIYEVLIKYPRDTDILNTLNIAKDKYFLVTAHREENVDNEKRLFQLLSAFVDIHHKYKLPIIFSRHPRTEERMTHMGSRFNCITYHEPFGLFDFQTLMRNAFCVLTDSGITQEECCILGIRCVTLRDNTERPETLECGSNILAGVVPADVIRCLNVTLSMDTVWTVPEGYLDSDVSDKVVKILLGC